MDHRRTDNKSNLKVFYALSVAWQLGFAIVVPIAGFIFLAMLCGKFFGFTPLFLVLGIAIGIIVTIYESYHLVAPLIKKQ